MSGPITLSTARPNVTLTGTINAYGSVDVGLGGTYYAAVFGPSGADFTVTNLGLIDDRSTAQFSAGIILAAAGTITNESTIECPHGFGILVQSDTGGSYIRNDLLISAFLYGVGLNGAGTVVNAGTINASAAGIAILGGGYAANSGLISGTYGYGMIFGGPCRFNNTGQIDKSTGVGIGLKDSGAGTNSGQISGFMGIDSSYAINFTNTSNGIIRSVRFGVVIYHGASSVLNQGTIDSDGAAIHIYGGGTVVNQGTLIGFTGVELRAAGSIVNTGVIRATEDGVAAVTAGDEVDNAGTITSGDAGVVLLRAGTVSNAASGYIQGLTAGIVLEHGGTIFEYGTVSGGIVMDANGGHRLVIDAASDISGSVYGGGGVLEIAADGDRTAVVGGTVPFADFGSIRIDPHAIVQFDGNVTEAVGNDGTIVESATLAPISIDSAITGAGVVILARNTLTLNGGVGNSQKISFTGTGEALDLSEPETFEAKIEKFTAGDTIDLTGITLSAITATHFLHGVLTLDEGATKLEFTFANPASFGAATFALTATGQGTAITLAQPAALMPVTHVTSLATLPTFGS